MINLKGSSLLPFRTPQQQQQSRNRARRQRQAIEPKSKSKSKPKPSRSSPAQPADIEPDLPPQYDASPSLNNAFHRGPDSGTASSPAYADDILQSRLRQARKRSEGDGGGAGEEVMRGSRVDENAVRRAMMEGKGDGRHGGGIDGVRSDDVVGMDGNGEEIRADGKAKKWWRRS